jgi:hypothetical protein
VDLDSAAAGAGEEGSSGTGGGGGGGGTSSSFDRPPPHRICLPGVHSFAQLQVRLYETSMAQLALLRNELRQTVRFLLTLLNSIVEHGVNAQRQFARHFISPHSLCVCAPSALSTHRRLICF